MFITSVTIVLKLFWHMPFIFIEFNSLEIVKQIKIII